MEKAIKDRDYICKKGSILTSASKGIQGIIETAGDLCGLVILPCWHLPAMDATFLVTQTSFHSTVTSQTVKGDLCFTLKIMRRQWEWLICNNLKNLFKSIRVITITKR